MAADCKRDARPFETLDGCHLWGATASHHRPADREQRLGRRALGQPLLELINQLVTLEHDLVLDREDFLPLVDVLVEVLEQGAPRIVEARADLLVHLVLQRAEGRVDGFWSAALLVDGEDALLDPLRIPR